MLLTENGENINDKEVLYKNSKIRSIDMLPYLHQLNKGLFHSSRSS